jgi:hypothetical protein
LEAFLWSDCWYFCRKASHPTVREQRSARPRQNKQMHALAVLHAVRPARWPCCTANVRGSQTARTDLRGSLCLRRLPLAYSWTDPVGWFSGAVQRVHACLGDSFPALVADAFRRHLACTHKHCQNPARLVPQGAWAKDLVEHAQPCAQQPCQRSVPPGAAQERGWGRQPLPLLHYERSRPSFALAAKVEGIFVSTNPIPWP